MSFISIFQELPKHQGTPEHLGGKGHGLWWMQQQGINVPPAMILSTEMCANYRAAQKTTMKEIKDSLPALKEFFKDQLGYMPLVSVRSGARVSMPGMMDTILNVGLTPSNFDEWVTRLGADCVLNCGDRLQEMYCSTVLGLKKEQHSGDLVPDSADAQILNCIEAVFKSWDNERAKFYRKMHDIPEDWGTAVVVQAMVFGNMNENSGTGVLFTRNPDTGENKITGEYLMNAQGEDVVAGTATPLPLSQLSLINPALHKEICDTVKRLELLKRDVQDVEFTIQDGKLYILQTRNAKRSAKAAVKIAVDMLNEHLINAGDVFNRVSAREFDLAQQPVLDPSFKTAPVFTGIPACSGVVTGEVVLSSEAAINCKNPCILVTNETTPDDIAGMHAAKGVLTMTGGATSHAAVVARSMNKPCVVGLSQDIKKFKAGMKISICGATGRVWASEVPIIDGSGSEDIKRLTYLLWPAHALPMSQTKLDTSYLLRMEDYFHLPEAEQVELVKSMAPESGVLYVDCRKDYDEDQMAILQFFHPQGDQELRLVQALSKFVASNPEWKEKLVLITKHGEGSGFNTITSADTLEHLIIAEGRVVLGVPPSPVLDKLLQLKGKELYPVSVGTFYPGVTSFVSTSKMVVDTLKP